MEAKFQARRLSMPAGSTGTGNTDSTPSSPRGDLSSSSAQQQDQAQNASSRPIRQGVNIYSRPASTSSSQASPGTSMMESPRRNSLFNSLRFSKVRRESRDSPGQSPMGSIDQQDQSDAPSPRKLSGLWETFRPRSKSDSRARKIASPSSTVSDTTATPSATGASTTTTTMAQPTGTATVGWPPPMASIPSCDEDSMSPPKRRSPESIARPLFVDTQLANRGGGGHRQSPAAAAVSKGIKSSPLAQVVDKISGARRRSLSGNTKEEIDRARVRTPSGPAAADQFFTNAAGGFTSRDGRHKILLPQRSLDSGLDGNVTGSSGGFMLREAGFFLGSAAHSFVTAQIENDDFVYVAFMRVHKCYDLIPTSAKLVAFDTQLPVKKAFFALVYNGVRAAPLWDSKQRQFVGMLTITDFIHILRRYYRSGVPVIQELEDHKIATWRDVLSKDGLAKPFFTLDPNDSLLNAVKLLCESKVHRLPVMDPATGNILYILTHKRILRFLYIYINDLPAPVFLQKTPKELGVGTWGDILTVQQDTLLIDALAKFMDNRVSALPVLDSNGKVVDIYAKFDVVNLAADKSYNSLEITVQDALKHRSEWFEDVRNCKESDSLAVVIRNLVKAEVHRIIITDEEKRVRGIVSLSDILRYLVLTAPNNGMERMDTS